MRIGKKNLDLVEMVTEDKSLHDKNLNNKETSYDNQDSMPIRKVKQRDLGV